mmetsp:Transcript_89781/g.262445  ORF Transcript_89781/g.262445 Transcript_89781/m.262445 type:complete len:269 (-) Transcript_89781:309-1115(-)
MTQCFPLVSQDLPGTPRPDPPEGLAVVLGDFRPCAAKALRELRVALLEARSRSHDGGVVTLPFRIEDEPRRLDGSSRGQHAVAARLLHHRGRVPAREDVAVAEDLELLPNGLLGSLDGLPPRSAALGLLAGVPPVHGDVVEAAPSGSHHAQEDAPALVIRVEAQPDFRPDHADGKSCARTPLGQRVKDLSDHMGPIQQRRPMAVPDDVGRGAAKVDVHTVDSRGPVRALVLSQLVEHREGASDVLWRGTKKLNARRCPWIECVYPEKA